MAKHQIIYTSCMRGIDGINDGQQIFSYDASFADSQSDDVRGLFTYQVPTLPAGTLMSEELALTMPSSFTYRYLKNGNVSITLNTYLGRDYMGSTGRFGNHLSHSIICDFEDLAIYPCEMYGSTALRNRMSFDEVNNPNPPDYLPTPELTKGYYINVDSVIEFLGIGDNLEYYKKMVSALLRFPEEKRRIIICDEPENIAKWIAALHYTLPLEIAKKVNFTTYEYDPELSASQICGVISDGSRYNAMNYIASNRHYVFDFKAAQFSDIDASGNFMDFLDAVMSFSYDSLTEFQAFVIKKTTYRACGAGYYSAYYLYNLLTDGISEIQKEEFDHITAFSEEYLTEDIRSEVVIKLISEKESINSLSNTYALRVLGFMLQSIDILTQSQQEEVKQLIVERLILALSTEGIGEASFRPLYDNIDRMARRMQLSIPAELMVEKNRNALLSVLGQQVELWKVLFIVRIIGDYVKDTALPTDELYPDRPIGKIYYGIIRLACASGEQNGNEVVDKLLDGYKDNAGYFVNMTLNAEGCLKDLGLSDSDYSHLWEYFYNGSLSMDASGLALINKELLEYDRFDEAYQLYYRQLRSQLTLRETRDFFANYWGVWFVQNPDYGKAHAATALRDYASIFKRMMDNVPEKDRIDYATEILHRAFGMNITDQYVSDLCRAVCALIPVEKISADNFKLINAMCRYQIETVGEPLEGKLLLHWIAIQLRKIVDKRDISTITTKIKHVEKEGSGAKFNNRTEGKIKDYFDWTFNSLNNFSLSSKDFAAIYDLFSLDRHSQSLFMEYWCKITYKKSKGDKDYADFAEFLSFMFEKGSLADQNMVGKYLCKLGKQKLEDLDTEMKTYFRRDRKATHAWENVREIAEKTNPLLKNLSGLFKRK